MPTPFLDALRRLSDAVDILDEHTLGEVMEEIRTYLQVRQPSLVLVELLGAGFAGSAPKLFTIRCVGRNVSKRWDSEITLGQDGNYAGQVSFAFDHKLKLCIVAKDRRELDRDHAEYEDLWSSRDLRRMPRFKALPYDEVGNVKTSIMLPLYVEVDGYVGLLNLEFLDVVEPSEEERQELESLARAVAVVSLLHRSYMQQKAGTHRAMEELRATRQGAQQPFDKTLVVLATTNDEYVQLLRAFHLTPANTQRSKEGHVVTTWRGRGVVLAKASQMGMPAAAATAMHLVDVYRPKYLAMCGIAAGVEGIVKLGDIIVADPSWDYGSGKLVSSAEGGDGARRFELEIRQERMDPEVRRLVEEDLARDRDFRDSLGREAFVDYDERGQLSIFVGAVASGAAVIEAPDLLQWIRSQQDRKLIGLEMEIYGVMFAARHSRKPRPTVICAKAVSDFAKPGRDRSIQPQAAYVSAAFIRELVVRLEHSHSH